MHLISFHSFIHSDPLLMINFMALGRNGSVWFSWFWRIGCFLDKAFKTFGSDEIKKLYLSRIYQRTKNKKNFYISPG